MMKRATLILYALIAMLVLGACSRPTTAELPTLLPTQPGADLTALAARRPTLPPTFTPIVIPTETSVAETVPHTESLTPTLTLTPTLAASPTFTVTFAPSPTATWTPDTLLRVTPIGTETPETGTPAVPATSTPNLGCVAPAGAPNLLQNPGIEAGNFTQFVDIQTPDRWIAFWLPDGTAVPWDPENQDGYRRPQVRVITKTDMPYDTPPRVFAGNQALYIAGGNRAYDAGIYQQVGAAANDRYCLSAYAHAWSSHQSDDPTKSRLITPEDKNNITFQLGIDPSGGTNPYAASVVWGPTANIYDQYALIPSVQARAETTTITVFVRGWAHWRFDHNDMFFDEIKLVKTN